MRSWASDLSAGFQAGTEMANSVLGNIRAMEEMKDRRRSMAIQEALLQKENPGLYLGQKEAVKTGEMIGDQPVYEAKATPFKPNDQSVQKLADGAYYSPELKKEIDRDLMRQKIDLQLEEGKALWPQKLMQEEERLKLGRKYASNITPSGVAIRYDDEGNPIAQDIKFDSGSTMRKEMEAAQERLNKIDNDKTIDAETRAERRAKEMQIIKQFDDIEMEKLRQKGAETLADRVAKTKPIEMSEGDKGIVRGLASKNANKISVSNQLKQALNTIQDPNIDEQTKVKIAQATLKPINSPEGQDAIQKEERERIGSLLEYNFGGPEGIKAALSGQGAWIGRDLAGFTKQLEQTVKDLDSGIEATKKTIEETESKYRPLDRRESKEMSFSSEKDVEAAGLADGTPIIVNGRKAIYRR